MFVYYKMPEKVKSIEVSKVGNAKYKAVDEVLEALRSNGAKRIGLLTRPEATTAGP